MDNTTATLNQLLATKLRDMSVVLLQAADYAGEGRTMAAIGTLSGSDNNMEHVQSLVRVLVMLGCR
jgi:hypothetical protein